MTTIPEEGDSVEESIPPRIRLKNARKEASVTLYDIKRQSGLDTGYLSKVEKGSEGVTDRIIAAYEKAIGKSLGITPTSRSRMTPERIADLEEKTALLRDAENYVCALAVGETLTMIQSMRLGKFFREMETMLKEKRKRG